jgi:uncharacterized FlaG/YvyC family protein
MAAVTQTSINSAAGQGIIAAGTSKDVASGQPEAIQQQSGLSEASIVSLMQQDGVIVNFSIDKNTNDFVVKVINPFTNQVIREIPPQEIPTLATNIQHVAGILVDKHA